MDSPAKRRPDAPRICWSEQQEFGSREVVVERDVFGEDADMGAHFARVAKDVHARHDDLAFGRQLKAAERPDHGRFARGVPGENLLGSAGDGI